MSFIEVGLVETGGFFILSLNLFSFCIVSVVLVLVFAVRFLGRGLLLDCARARVFLVGGYY